MILGIFAIIFAILNVAGGFCGYRPHVGNANGVGSQPANVWIILAAIGVGSAIGWIIARKIKMTAMPQLVSFYNATGGAASALVALLEFPNADMSNWGSALVTLLGLIIGSMAFSGSMIAYGKGRKGKRYPGRTYELCQSCITGWHVRIGNFHSAIGANTSEPQLGYLFTFLCIASFRSTFRDANWRIRYASCYFPTKQFYRNCCSHGRIYL